MHVIFALEQRSVCVCEEERQQKEREREREKCVRGHRLPETLGAGEKKKKDRRKQTTIIYALSQQNFRKNTSNRPQVYWWPVIL